MVMVLIDFELQFWHFRYEYLSETAFDQHSDSKARLFREDDLGEFLSNSLGRDNLQSSSHRRYGCGYILADRKI